MADSVIPRNVKLLSQIRDSDCEDCFLSEEAQGANRCVMAKGAMKPKVLVVSKFPPGGSSQKYLLDALENAGFSEDEFAFTGAVKCRAFESQPSRISIRECKKYLDAEIEILKPEYILALGNEALTATTGHSGIMKYRGKMIEKNGIDIFPTIAVGAAQRAPSQEMGFKADLSFLAGLLKGIEPKGPGKNYTFVDSEKKLKKMFHTLADSGAVAFDLETKSFDEQESGAFIVTLAITCISTHTFDTFEASTDPLQIPMKCFSVPLRHDESPWRFKWKKLLKRIVEAINLVPRRIAHNAKFDCRWLQQFSVGVEATFDTMLAAHLLNENRAKGLKPLARFLLGAPEWDIKIQGGRNPLPWWEQHSVEEIAEYNALDTWYTAQLYWKFRAELLEDRRLLKVFREIMMPASNAFVQIERRGVWASRESLEHGLKLCTRELRRIDQELLKWVPDETPLDVNFRPSNFLRWFLYEHLRLPILKRGKTGPSVAETVISHLRDEHPAIPLLLERVGWQKYRDGFFNPYLEQLTRDSRIHTTFKLTGTVTGRLSSGKADLDKVTGARSARGVNLQQVPRDTMVRSCFGAPPGWKFIQADYSQIELRIAAFLAQEPTMLHIYQTGQDIHTAMACRMTGKSPAQLTKEERKRAKPVNFGFLYGMGWRRFIQTAWDSYGLVFTEEEAQHARYAFFKEFPLLVPWHAKQRRMVRANGRVQSPLGRIRHLPDIYSSAKEVVAEAERQAINSPVQSFASDLTILSLVRLEREFKARDLQTRALGTVHDAINFEAPESELELVVPIIKETMENLPIDRLFDIQLNVPIVADIEVSDRWGGGLAA